MKVRQLLFVTLYDEHFEEGLSYATDLAKVMNNSISLLMIHKRKVMEKFGDMKSEAVYAGDNEHKTAGKMIKEDHETDNESDEERLNKLADRCRQAGIQADINVSAEDAVSAIRNLLRQNTNIEMVLLSPGITRDNHITGKDLNRLVKTASRPIVTMAKNDHAA